MIWFVSASLNGELQQGRAEIECATLSVLVRHEEFSTRQSLSRRCRAASGVLRGLWSVGNGGLMQGLACWGGLSCLSGGMYEEMCVSKIFVQGQRGT